MNMMDLNSKLDIKRVDQLSQMLEEQNLDQTSMEIFSEFKQILLPYIHTYKNLTTSIGHATSIMIMNLKGRMVYVDDYFCELTQYSRNELLGTSFDRLTEDHAVVGDLSLLQHGETLERERCFRNKSGNSFCLKTTMAPLRNQDDEIISIIIYGLNIMKPKEQESDLIDEMKNDFSRTMNALVNLVFKVEYNHEDEQFYYSLFEGKLARDIGLTTSIVQGKRLHEIFGESQAQLYYKNYQKAYKGESISYKHQYKERHFYTTLSPVKENGEVIEIIGSSVEITSYEEAELRIQHMTSHDPLTDLPNRNKLQYDLNDILYKKDANETVTVMFCDLDRFKYVNDALGHIAGDQVLQLMAKRISHCISPEDRLYRLGGDEFILYLRGSKDQSDLMRIGKNVLEQIGKPINLMGKEFFITASIGASQYPESAENSEELIAHADIAMHYCKMKGRQNVLFYTPDMNRYYNKLISMEGDLREAISRNQLSLNFQPKVSVGTGYLSGMEALVRWNHPEHGLISPGEFIPLAEETGLITQIDEWVLYEACRQNQRWIEQGYAPERVAVNVSANEIQRKDFVEKVFHVLKETKLDPRYLEIEVTENSVMQNTEDCIRTMQDLKALGVSLSIDDFGTGYSSLSYLRQFPIHYLKIDQAFIKDVLKDPSDAEIVKAMIQLAESFKLEVVAEGVEDEEVLQFLSENHCAYYQGYYFSKPLPPEEMEGLLMRKQHYY